MRVCAGLVLSGALCLGADASQASAATYCAIPVRADANAGQCYGETTTLQSALDLASAHPGPDTVGLNSGFYRQDWLDGDRLRPGNYRLVAIAQGARRRPARVRFTVIR